jgi:transcriptional regulator with XRE-family HTH domain
MSVSSTDGKSRLGAALRELRRQHGWTLTEVSRRTGFSVPTLSKVENDRVSLSYDKLIRLSEGLNIDIAQLFASGGGSGLPVSITGRRSINRLGDGQLVPTHNYDYRYLNTDVVQKRFIPIVTELHSQSLEEFGALVKHSGEEFIYVLEGEVEVHTELYAPLVLKAGESAYLDSAMGHAYLQRGATRCRLLAICSASEAHLREVMVKNEAAQQRRRPDGVAERGRPLAHRRKPQKARATRGRGTPEK